MTDYIDCTEYFNKQRAAAELDPVSCTVVFIHTGLRKPCGCEVMAMQNNGFTLRHCPEHAARFGYKNRVGYGEHGAAMVLDEDWKIHGLVMLNIEAGKFPHEI